MKNTTPGWQRIAIQTCASSLLAKPFATKLPGSRQIWRSICVSVVFPSNCRKKNMNTELSMCRSGAVDPRPISSWTSTALSFRTTTDATKFVQISNLRSNGDQNLLVCQQRITGQILRAATQKTNKSEMQKCEDSKNTRKEAYKNGWRTNRANRRKSSLALPSS